jgi:hypothetical protein
MVYYEAIKRKWEGELPGSDAADALPGRIVRALREWRSRDLASSIPSAQGKRGVRANKFSRAGFYSLCTEAERELRGAAELFPIISKSSAADRVEHIEHLGPARGEHEVLSVALRLPRNFLSQEYANPEAALRAAQRSESAPAHRPKPMGFLRIDPDELNPDYRDRAFQAFDEFVRFVHEGNRSLLFVEGRKGVGKTFLLSQWFWSVAEPNFAPAVSIDCASISLDQILPLVWQHISAAGTAEPRLLVLDGLRVEREAGAVTLLLPERHAGIAELVRIINRLWQDLANVQKDPSHDKRGPVGVIVVLENNGNPFKRRELARDLSVDATCTLLRVTPLGTEISAAFLKNRGLTKVSHEDRLRLAWRCQGLPGALAAIADEVDPMGPLERERYLTAMRAAPEASEPDSAFLEVFIDWLARHGEGEIDQSGDSPNPVRAHPHALLRLLAILLRPVSLSEIEEILGDVTIPRVSGRDIQDLVRGKYPYVRIVDDDLYELHPRAAEHLRDELAECVRTNSFDRFTSRAQLEEIHWKAATIRQRALLREDVADADVIATVEGFIHHICQQIRMIPPEDASRRRRSFASGMSETQLRDYKPGTLNRARLWSIGFHEAARFLLDRRRQSTRVHAQFEAKARILANLMRVAKEEAIDVPIGDVDVRKEIALCWMHAGRLQLALEAITQTSSEARRAERIAKGWRIATDRLSVEVTIRMRMGHPVERLEALLAERLKEAVRIALMSEGPKRRDERIPMQERGAIRILSRVAEVALLAGNPLKSLTRFSQATALQAHWPQSDGTPELLTGEAARRFVVALVRNRTGPDDLKYPRDLIAANIERSRRLGREPGAARPNDIISLRVLDASLSRVAGQLAAAEFQLASAKEDPLLQRREVTFQTRAEFDLEELRLDIVQKRERDAAQFRLAEADREVLRIRVKDFAGRMEESGHKLLQLDGLFLLAELLDGPERGQQCRALKRKMAELNQPMRQVDLALIEKGRSALLELGL